MSIVEKTTIQVSGIDVNIERKKIKNLHIGVYPPNGRVRVATPIYLDDEAVRFAVINRLSWIKRQIKNFQEQKRESKRQMISGESHYFLGKRYLLDVIYDSKKYYIVLRHSKIELHIKPNTTTKNRYKLLLEWYRRELYEIVCKLVAKWEKEIGIKLNNFQIKKMRTKWGSCNIEKKSILLNLHLARVPVECIEYIIVHEMVHLLQRHHNDIFKNYMDRFLPEWEKYRNILNQNHLAYFEWKL